MTDLKIGKYRVRYDGIQWIVTTSSIIQSGKKEGEEREASPGYHGRLSHALLDVWDRGLGDGDATDVRALQQAAEMHARAIVTAAAEADGAARVTRFNAAEAR